MPLSSCTTSLVPLPPTFGLAPPVSGSAAASPDIANLEEELFTLRGRTCTSLQQTFTETLEVEAWSGLEPCQGSPSLPVTPPFSGKGIWGQC